MRKASIDGQIDKEEYLKMTYYKFVQLDKLLDDAIFDMNLKLGKRISSDYKFDSQDVLFRINKKVFDKICILASNHLDKKDV